MENGISHILCGDKTIGTLPTLLIAVLATLLLAGNPAVAQEDAGNWGTTWSERAGVTLEHSFDSSGPDAWDSAAHPLVFVSTEGPGYGGLLSGVTLPGLVIIDADTHEVVASQTYDVLGWGWKNVFEPHGLGVSPDGKWIYLPTGEGSFGTKGDNAGRFLVINAGTLKLDKVIKIPGQAHHAKSYRTKSGAQRVMLYEFNGAMYVVDPDQDNNIVGAILDETMRGERLPYLYFMSPEGDSLVATGANYQPSHGINEELTSNLYFFDPESWELVDKQPYPEGSFTWATFTSDNNHIYVSASHSHSIYKFDRETHEAVAKVGAGVYGPYGVHLGWDNDMLYVVGKGEHSHNRGKSVGIVSGANMDAKFEPRPGGPNFNPLHMPLDEVYTGCVRGDHGTLHPDPDANEIWITCNASFEIVVFDLDLRQVTARIAMPHGGSTHSGAFVRYGGDSVGEVLSDQNGLHGSALEIKRQLLFSF